MLKKIKLFFVKLFKSNDDVRTFYLFTQSVLNLIGDQSFIIKFVENNKVIRLYEYSDELMSYSKECEANKELIQHLKIWLNPLAVACTHNVRCVDFCRKI